MKNFKITCLMLSMFILVTNGCATVNAVRNSKNFGKYIGTVKSEWLPDGRKMRILELFTYIDPKGIDWQAPAGSIVDGASIPRVAWPIIGGPFEGKYRDASVIHDVACVEQARSWEDTHMAFYTAMRASGVSYSKASLMYCAVYHLGPRWPIMQKLQAVDVLDIENVKNTKLLDHALGTDIAVISREALVDQPDMVNLVLEINPPPKVLREADVARLMEIIKKREQSQQGPMSLQEIRDYHP